ncbi:MULTISPECIES: hypothetical protein [Ochrobactrum]|uniref:Uncharacterized protein n=1 Tax=Ochrobactrum soli TaxID=2448455 RepID=A0A2P9HES8_9HYPH|nr:MULTISPECIES: hypothetical protein [Brucella/Ochrobactrum group]SPL62624.1 hypothetical protein OHAE_5231 [[Ochrobactrum] soli]
MLAQHPSGIRSFATIRAIVCLSLSLPSHGRQAGVASAYSFSAVVSIEAGVSAMVVIV